MEFGQGDVNHPIGIRPDCGTTGWFGGCSRPANSHPYQSSNYCGSGRDYGMVSVGFRERVTYRDPNGVPDGSRAEQAAISCQQILNDGLSRGDGVYWVDPNGGFVDAAARVLCDMSTVGGGRSAPNKPSTPQPAISGTPNSPEYGETQASAALARIARA